MTFVQAVEMYGDNWRLAFQLAEGAAIAMWDDCITPDKRDASRMDWCETTAHKRMAQTWEAWL